MLHYLIQQHNSTPVASSTTPLILRTKKDFYFLEKPNGNLPTSVFHLLGRD